MSDCIFCRIVSGDLQADVVHEGDRVLAFRDINPQAPTHIQIVPREHVPAIAEFDAARDGAWLIELFTVAAELARREGLDRGYRLVINNGPLAGQIIRRRRSAVAFDGKTSISAVTFFNSLFRVMPQAHLPQMERPSPWDVWPWSPAVHLALFVHRVEGLGPGLYVLVRDPEKLPLLQRAMNPEFGWASAPGCPAGLPLFWLLEGDARRVAAQVSCHQDIAGDGAFSLGMIAEFEGNLRRHGPWFYPRLFWECGLLGQVLYLEAEAAGVRATGIGCFFDDPVHDLLGIKDRTFQSLYHFTVGGPVDDPRLLTLPPYSMTGEGRAARGEEDL